MPENVLQDWSDYDRRKLAAGEPSDLIIPDNAWEADYLADRIAEIYPVYSHSVIHTAIAHCRQQMPGAQLRETFVRCVMEQIRHLPN